MAFTLRAESLSSLESKMTSQTNPAPAGVLELRQYTLHPGQRDTLVELFEREFVHTQEALGITLPGLFRDLDDDDRFVWLRGFPDMPARATALAAFYGGAAWLAHRDAANATMIDSDNVLLLRPVGDASIVAAPTPAPIRTTAQASPRGIVIATIYRLASAVDGVRFLGFFNEEIKPVLDEAGAQLLATCASEHAANTFPKLPVRENENVFVSLAAFDGVEAHAGCTGQMHSALRIAAGGELAVLSEQVLRLSPTPRSQLPAHPGEH